MELWLHRLHGHCLSGLPHTKTGWLVPELESESTVPLGTSNQWLAAVEIHAILDG